MPFCKACGREFERRPMATNQKYCDDCSYWHRYKGRKMIRQLANAEPALRAVADAAGNPKVWTARQCSQEFLNSLIPGTK